MSCIKKPYRYFQSMLGKSCFTFVFMESAKCFLLDGTST